MKKFLLVDDHVVVRSGIKMLLLEIFKPCEVFEAGDEESAKEKLKEGHFDLILMDIQMPKSDTLGLVEFINREYPKVNVLIFSMSAEQIYAKRYFKAGARGYLSKDADLNEIKKAITLILNGRKYISESLVEMLANAAKVEAVNNPFERLTQREFEIAQLLLKGNSVTEISQSLNLGISTVGTHKARIFVKLGIKNTMEMKELAIFHEL